MSPQLSADLHQQGILTTTEAMWIYDKDGRVVANIAVLIKNGEPIF